MDGGGGVYKGGADVSSRGGGAVYEGGGADVSTRGGGGVYTEGGGRGSMGGGGGAVCQSARAAPVLSPSDKRPITVSSWFFIPSNTSWQ
jgi:hypothetical protein